MTVRPLAVAILATLVGCEGQTASPPASPSPSPSPTVAEPTVTPSPTRTDIEVAGLETVFEGVQGYTFRDVPAGLARSQLQPVLGSVRRTGEVIDSVSKEAIADGERTGIIATVVVVEPKGGESAAQAFQAVLQSIVFGPPQRAAGGQAFAFSALGVDILLAPIAVEPALLLLSVVGIEGQPTDHVTEQILRANSG